MVRRPAQGVFGVGCGDDGVAEGRKDPSGQGAYAGSSSTSRTVSVPFMRRGSRSLAGLPGASTGQADAEAGAGLPAEDVDEAAQWTM